MQIKTIHITTFQEKTWGRIYLVYENENQIYYAFKNFINFIEHNFVGIGSIDEEPTYNWFTEEKRYTYSLDDVLSGKADVLNLTPEWHKIKYGTPSNLLKRLLIDVYSGNLTPVEKRRGWFEHFYIPQITLSELHITKDYKQIVFNDYHSEFLLEPLMKTLYIFYLKHLNGVKRTYLSDFEEELMTIYMQITNKSDFEKVRKGIQSLIDNNGKSFDEKISKIKKGLIDLLGDKIASFYIIQKMSDETYKINLPSEKIIFD